MKLIIRKASQLIFIVGIASYLIACGGADVGVGGDDGEIVIVGTAAEGAPIQNAIVEIKSQSGTLTRLTTNQLGQFSSGALNDTGPFITRVVDPSGGFLHSLAFSVGANSINNNIHPISDLIVRNWAAQRDVDLEILFASNGAVSLPLESEVNAVESEIFNIIRFALLEFGSLEAFDLLSTPFNADGTGFDGFLDFTQVFIDDDSVTVTITDPDPGSQVTTNIIEGLALDNDFLSAVNEPPSVPEQVRAVVSSVQEFGGEVIVVWNPSTDDEGVAGYNVYRNGEFASNTPYPVFVDEGLPLEQSYVYSVEAIDGRGAISARSEDSLDLFLNEPDTTAPATAENLQVSQVDLTLELTWLQAEINDVFGFRVIRDDDTNFAQVTGTRFIDRDVIDGETYCYQIVTFDASENESAPSEQVCTVFGGSEAPSQVNLTAQSIVVSEADGIATIGVQRFGNRGEEISIAYRIVPVTAQADIDFMVADGTLTWLANESGVRSFDIQLLTDFVVEENETLRVQLFNPSTNTMIGSISEATVTIEDSPFSCTELSAGDVTSDVVLSDPCYTVIENINVSNNVELTVLPGVSLVFSDGVELTIADDGLLTAIGNAENRILFTGATQDLGSWGGISIGSNGLSRLEHFTVEYGGATAEANIGLFLNGQLSVSDGIIRFSSAHGLIKTESQSITNFSNLQFKGNNAAPVSIDANSLNILNASNTFVGNEPTAGINFDFIQVTSAADITTNQTWPLLDVPYRFVDNAYNLRADLQIEAGVELEFTELSAFIVEPTGQLQAIGTALSPIVFTGAVKEPAAWDKLIFTSSNNDNILDHVVIEYAGATAPTGPSTNLFITGDNSRVDLQNVKLRRSGLFGIAISNQPTITGNNITITENALVGSTPDISNIDFLNINGSYTGNDKDTFRITDLTVEANVILPNVGVIYQFFPVRTCDC